MDIIEEIRKVGFNGSNTQAYHNINVIRNNFNISTPSFVLVQQPVKIPYVKILSSRKLAKFIGSCLPLLRVADFKNRSSGSSASWSVGSAKGLGEALAMGVDRREITFASSTCLVRAHGLSSNLGPCFRPFLQEEEEEESKNH